ncbi:bacteriohopanetetrol glucosamine biosynthesis glycosyltransferase HpnI [Cupriavidus campinensis]
MTGAVWSSFLGHLLAGATTAYAVIAAAVSRRPVAGKTSRELPPISVLKPLCGAEPRLYQNLEGLCRQDYPAFQLVFGVCDAKDPAIEVVQRLRAAYPQCDIELVIDARVHGRNPKVSNLINLFRAARHDHLVLADSDIAVPTDYLTRLAGPLSDPHVGVVTCAYRGQAIAGLWTRLGAAFINQWFVPSVRVAHAGGSRRFAFGATIALRRDTLNAIGGFAALANRLADDFWLGELTRRAGWRTVLSDIVVETDVTEARFPDLWRHELRWLRTIRSLSAAGFSFMFVTFTWPMLALACIQAPQPDVFALAVIGAVARSVLAGEPTDVLLAPLRDGLLLVQWAAALTGGHVLWRGHVMSTADQPDTDHSPQAGTSRPASHNHLQPTTPPVRTSPP